MQKSLGFITSRIKIALAQPKLTTREGQGRSFETLFVIEVGWSISRRKRNRELREANSRDVVVNRLARTLSRARTVQHMSTEGTPVSLSVIKRKRVLTSKFVKNDIDSA